MMGFQDNVCGVACNKKAVWTPGMAQQHRAQPYLPPRRCICRSPSLRAVGTVGPYQARQASMRFTAYHMAYLNAHETSTPGMLTANADDQCDTQHGLSNIAPTLSMLLAGMCSMTPAAALLLNQPLSSIRCTSSCSHGHKTPSSPATASALPGGSRAVAPADSIAECMMSAAAQKRG